MSIREMIIEFMEEKKYKPMLKEELAVQFDIERRDLESFYKILEGLEREGIVIKAKNDKYGLIDNDYLVAGILEGNERGFGFVIPNDKIREDIFIPAENMNGAMHGDRVIANITRRQETDRREEGEIIRILERNNKIIVGTFEDNRNFGFVVPDDHKIRYDIFIPKAKTRNAKTNQKVVVEITTWPEPRRNPEGKVIEVLGYLDEKGTDILSIIRQFNLPEEFPNKVQEAAKNIEQEVDPKEAKRRVDLRHLNTFTIDGIDAKDIDDAVSIEMKDNGNYYLGVHIADVAHYVREKSTLDKEALQRGNSVYLIDRVIPMLPKELSNGICSLNPNVDRLSLSVFMEIDKKGKVVDHEIVEGLINSKQRLVYDDVSDFLENDDEVAKEKLSKVAEDLKLMEELCHILYEKRERRGSIDFDFPEAKIILDEKGVPIEIRKEERRIANRLIEEFMLVCNETVAERFFWSQTPFLYRIHEEPSAEKIATFSKLIHNFGYTLKGQQEVHPKELQLLTKEIRGKKEETLISTLMLRSLKKAIYSNEPGIHFGLAAQYYSHFTAPIRRYPDLVIHRIIKAYLNGKLSDQVQGKLEANLPEIAEHTSMTERRAEEAEREVEDMKKAQYMTKHIGEEFEGIVSSLTNFGMFVQLENTIEGLVHFNNMLDDYYHFDEEKYYIIGERTNKIYRLGDMAKIRVIDADVMRRNIDFELL
ncbi:ribonuclease R [Tissierella carlieri]|jgi:ribonuclease R|uniref:ribonuclease R n=1 Tax=Tissierella carlieri TaxID=689904 RepID=UPI001C123221|nr:ribonuclease R [Tissierella carlieri]MBU5312457.1 ribonuclease R [Tissierella carlieri]